MSNGRASETMERQAVNLLRSRFEALGYRFEPEPDPSDLPSFLSGYRPDAIATRGDEHVAIEVKSRGGDTRSIAELRSLFAGHPTWRLAVVLGNDALPDEEPVPVPKVGELREAAERVASLLDQGFAEPALLMGFAVLEAAQKLAGGSGDERFLKPGTVVQSLAMEGLIDRETEAKLRSIIATRNSIAHGAIRERVNPDDVRLVLATIERVLATAFAA